MKTIQMIPTSEDNSIFIVAFDLETEVLQFRTTRNPEYLQREKIVVDKDTVFTNLFNFHVGYLQKFLSETREETEE